MTGTDITPYDGGQLAEFGPQIMTPEAAKELDRQLRLCVKAVLREGVDYGVIPGTGDEKVLRRPGAQRLLQWFQLAFTCDRVDTEIADDGRKHGITYRATVTKRGTGEILTTCEGTADYDEDKFYQSAEQVESRLRKQEHKWAEKDGRRPNPARWMDATEYRAPWNTLVKRAQKRAIVGAVIDATAAGGIFHDDDDSQDAAPDGGPSNYERAIDDAFAVTSKDAATELWNWVVEAANHGDFTPRQKNHIQNCIKLRVKELEKYVQVDFESPSPAQDGPPSSAPAQDEEPARQQGAGEASVPPAEQAPDSRPSRGQRPAGGAARGDRPARAINKRFAMLGADDEHDRLILLAKMLRLDDIPAEVDALTSRQSEQALAILNLVIDGGGGIEALNDLINDGEVPDGQ